MSDFPPPQPAQSGLSDNAAGALAYVTIIPAIIFLVVEPYNKNSFIRFHCLAIHLPQHCCLRNPNGADGDSSDRVDHSSICCSWRFLCSGSSCLLKALKGERYQLPIIGKYAAQQAGA